MVVYVVNRQGKPLMPCHPAKARILLKKGKAKVVQRTPFTIQLLYGSSGYRQPITLGVDSGTKIHASASVKELQLLEGAKTFLIEPRLLPAVNDGVSGA